MESRPRYKGCGRAVLGVRSVHGWHVGGTSIGASVGPDIGHDGQGAGEGIIGQDADQI